MLSHIYEACLKLQSQVHVAVLAQLFFFLTFLIYIFISFIFRYSYRFVLLCFVYFFIKKELILLIPVVLTFNNRLDPGVTAVVVFFVVAPLFVLVLLLS